MSEIEVFQFPATGQRVRTVVRDGEPWFVATDVAAALDLRDHRTSVALLDEDERHSMPVTDALGRQQQTLIVNEPGLYSLILRSRKPEAKAFKRWITHEVLPAIRRTGQYGVARQLPQSYAEALRELASTVERAEYAERELADAAPKAEAWRVLASAEGDYSVRDAAYILNRDPAIDTGQNRLFTLLRDWKLVDRNDRPYADHSRHVRLRAMTRSDKWSGEELPWVQVRITVEGLRYLHKRMGGVEQLRFVVPSEVA